MSIVIIIFGFLLLSFTPHETPDTFLPPNDLHLNLLAEDEANVSEKQFNAIIDQVQEIYGPIVESYGAVLTFNRYWGNETVNASASQFGDTWNVNMFGGLARRAEVTPDGFALVVCHELGHHLGGYAFYDSSWAASEGQSDYFATLSCARQLWSKELENNRTARETIPDHPKALCDDVWAGMADRDLCYRSMLGGKSLADLLGALRGDQTNFDTPDENIVTRTSNSHPAAQCRLDTYMAGSLCATEFDIELIPGKSFENRNSLEAEAEANQFSCSRLAGATIGTRPGCWYKAQLTEEEDEDDTKI